MSLLTDLEFSKVRALKRFGVVASTNSAIEWVNINTVSPDIIQEYFRGAETAFVFIVPTDLSDITQLTRSMLEMATAAGVRRLAWVAPACPTGGELSDVYRQDALHLRLTEAANLVRDSGLETLVLSHAPLLSDLLEQKKELKFRRTLSLPLGNSSLPWLAPEVIAQALYKWTLGELNHEPPELLTGATQRSGQDIAKGLSDVLTQTMNTRQFAQLRFQAIDLDQSGEIDAAELFPYLLDLGYSHDDAQTILQQADRDNSGTIDFEEFIQGLEEHLNKILAKVPTEVRYEPLPRWQVALFREPGRNLSRQIWMNISVKSIEDQEKKAYYLRLIAAFFVAMTQHLRREEVDDRLKSILAPEHCLQLKNVSNMPLKITQLIGAYLAQKYRQQHIDSIQFAALNRLLDQLVECLSRCERILNAPMPKAYSIHLRHLLILYCFALPFQMVKDLHWWTVPAVGVVAFVLFGIEAIGLEIENPFGYDANDIPLDNLCRKLHNDIEELIAADEDAIA